MKLYSIFFALCLLLFGTSVAFAHKPIFVDPRSNLTRETAIRIADPGVSWAVYAQLSEAGEVDYYTFAGKRGMKVEIAMSVPKIEATRDFGVVVALAGRSINGGDLPSPMVLREGEGFVSAPDSAHDETKLFNEDFTGTVYWTRQTLRATLAADELYTIAVFNDRGKTGKYVLAIGEREEFGVQDLLDFPNVRARVQQWFEHPLEGVQVTPAAAPAQGRENNSVPIIGLALAAAVGLGFVVLRRRR